jgi:hypothetical protein
VLAIKLIFAAVAALLALRLWASFARTRRK